MLENLLQGADKGKVLDPKENGDKNWKNSKEMETNQVNIIESNSAMKVGFRANILGEEQSTSNQGNRNDSVASSASSASFMTASNYNILESESISITEEDIFLDSEEKIEETDCREINGRGGLDQNNDYRRNSKEILKNIQPAFRDTLSSQYQSKGNNQFSETSNTVEEFLERRWSLNENPKGKRLSLRRNSLSKYH